jgi:hypothetical protein
MGFQPEVKIDMDKAPAPEQWNGEQHCQVCGNQLGWTPNGTSVCGHVGHSPSWEEEANGVLADLVRCEPGDTLSTGLLDRAKSLVKTVSAADWAWKAYADWSWKAYYDKQ